MNFLEKDLEQVIYEADTEMLADRGLNVYGKRKRQLRIGNYGICDLLTHQKNYHPYCGYFHRITIYELKKDVIGVSAFLQVMQYAKGVQSFMDNKGYDYDIEIVLIGKTIDLSGAICYLPSLFNNDNDFNLGFINSIRYYTYSYDIDGLRFTNLEGYTLSNEGFNYV